jgi:hypothetical protein
MQVNDQNITIFAYLLPVVGPDVILGAPWLSSLCPHLTDYATSMLNTLMVN